MSNQDKDKASHFFFFKVVLITLSWFLWQQLINMQFDSVIHIKKYKMKDPYQKGLFLWFAYSSPLPNIIFTTVLS